MENETIAQPQPVAQVPSYLQSLALYVNSLQEIMTQFQIWHWNTRDFIHLATEEVYKGLIDPIDALAETYVVMSKQFYKREKNPEFSVEFSAEAMNNICNNIIENSNKLAAGIPDEAVKGIIGNVIQIFRTAMYKIG